MDPGPDGDVRATSATPAATAAAITDGWLHTGDYARVDDEGYVFILDRKKDMIMRGGNKVYSVELEYLLVSHPDIAEAAVFGVPDRLAYESVAAYVVPAAGRTRRRRPTSRAGWPAAWPTTPCPATCGWST